ncbi:hypothetical protein OUZ56_008313 [Daphnia magna]|uniref:Uncharacterized protein n=1 Tax=Daphnia magna TaxID=35525 RepID=A0ABR0ACV1_9CRUS|nr:hypothetical protein OUZ56_008313 [Daphnia magna]
MAMIHNTHTDTQNKRNNKKLQLRHSPNNNDELAKNKNELAFKCHSLYIVFSFALSKSVPSAQKHQTNILVIYVQREKKQNKKQIQPNARNGRNT